MPRDEDSNPDLLIKIEEIRTIQELSQQTKELTEQSRVLESTAFAELARVDKTLRTQNKVLLYGVTALLFMNIGNMVYHRLALIPKTDSIESHIQELISNIDTKLDVLTDEVEHMIVVVESIENP